MTNSAKNFRFEVHAPKVSGGGFYVVSRHASYEAACKAAAKGTAEFKVVTVK